MLCTLLLLFIFLQAVFPTLVQQADPICHADVTSPACGNPLQGRAFTPNVLLAENRTVFSLTVKDNFANYIVSVNVGNRYYTLSIDTGSANIFLGAQLNYIPTSLGVNSTQPVTQSYVEGSSLRGFEFMDTITLGCATLNQSIGVANASSYGFKNTGSDGVLGIGPTQLTQGTLSNDPGQNIPTIIDNLVALNVTPSRTVGISFTPYNESNLWTGGITLGGIDQSKFVGPLIYVPITKTLPAANSVGINASIFYDNKPLLSNGAGIIDTGTTPLKLASHVFDAYTNASGVKNGIGYSSISTKNYNNLKPLVFVIGNSSFALTPDGQRFPPQSVGRKLFRQNPSTLLIPISSTNEPSGGGNDFVLGMTWLRRFYVVYDPDNEQVGVANTSYTDAIVD